MTVLKKSIWREREKRLKIMSAVARQNQPGRVVNLSRGQTYFELDKDQGGPLLICIHGWSTSSYVWTQLKPFFRNKGYRVLSYDLYGRGFSDRPEVAHKPKLFTQQLTELLESQGLTKSDLNIVGYSMGGAIAAHFVSQRLRDVDRLLLIAPAGMKVLIDAPRKIARRRSEFTRSLVLAMLPSLMRWQFRKAAADFRNNPYVQDVVAKQMRELSYQGYVPSLFRSLDGILSKRMETEHREIARSDVAVRALFASDDRTIPHPKAKDLFDQWHGNGVSRLITGVGHGLPYTHPHEVEREVANFL